MHRAKCEQYHARTGWAGCCSGTETGYKMAMVKASLTLFGGDTLVVRCSERCHIHLMSAKVPGDSHADILSVQDRDSAYLTVPYSGTGTCLSTVTASRWSTPSATCRPDRHCQNTRPVMPGVRFMTNLMQSLYLQIAPENNKENQFIDFRLITTSKEKSRFFLTGQQSDAQSCRAFSFARAQARPGVGLSPNSARTLATGHRDWHRACPACAAPAQAKTDTGRWCRAARWPGRSAGR